MEQFKALDDDWRQIGVRAKNYPSAEVSRAVLELRDRVAALEAAPDRVLVRSQTGEYLRAGTPLYLDSRNRLVSYSVGEARPLEECGKDHAVPDPAAAPAAPVVAVPSDEELYEIWNDTQGGSKEHFRALFDHGYEHGLAAGRAEQPATTEPPTDPDYDAPQTLHSVALGHVDGLRGLGVIPQICDTLRRAIREPMAEREAMCKPALQVADDLTPEPEPSPSPADGWLIAALEGIGLDDVTAGRVLCTVARWLRSKGYPIAASLLEQEANR